MNNKKIIYYVISILFCFVTFLFIYFVFYGMEARKHAAIALYNNASVISIIKVYLQEPPTLGSFFFFYFYYFYFLIMLLAIDIPFCLRKKIKDKIIEIRKNRKLKDKRLEAEILKLKDEVYTMYRNERR